MLFNVIWYRNKGYIYQLEQLIISPEIFAILSLRDLLPLQYKGSKHS